MGELRLAFYDGVFDGDLDALVHLCDVEGSVVPDDRPSFALLEEARRVLEMCREKYSAPRASGQHFTVLLGRKLGAQLGLRHTPSLEFVADVLPENAQRIEELVTRARQSDSELARVREGATYAGDPDPYRKPDDDDEDE